MPDLTIGCHLSLGRRPSISIQEASNRGARCAQIFASSPGAWKPPVSRPDWSTEVRNACDRFDVHPLVIHAIYLINLASANPAFLERSKRSLIETMKAAEQLGATTVVTHIGSHGGRGFEEVKAQVSRQIEEILEETPRTVNLALENSAGAGGILGSSLPELSDLLDAARGPRRLKIALDTAHLCGAGWDFGHVGEAQRLVGEIADTVGLERVALLHANDSKAAPGSRRDRHEVVGEGYVGIEGFLNLLSQPALTCVPWILETPDLDTLLPPDERMKSMAVLRELATEAVVKLPA